MHAVGGSYKCFAMNFYSAPFDFSSFGIIIEGDFDHGGDGVGSNS